MVESFLEQIFILKEFEIWNSIFCRDKCYAFYWFTIEVRVGILARGIYACAVIFIAFL